MPSTILGNMKKMNLLFISTLCAAAIACNDKEDSAVATIVNMVCNPSEIGRAHV